MTEPIEAQELERAATPGEWLAGPDPTFKDKWVITSPDRVIPEARQYIASHLTEADARLMAAAPALLSELKRLRAALEKIAGDDDGQMQCWGCDEWGRDCSYVPGDTPHCAMGIAAAALAAPTPTTPKDRKSE